VGVQTQRDYMGPFNGYARAQGLVPQAVWWHRSRTPGAFPFAYESGVQPWLCDSVRAPRPLGSPDYMGSVTYAYHTGAELFADLLAEHGRKRRIHHVMDHVTDVELDLRGHIAAVHGRERGRVEADFFVDCTGF